MHPGLSLDRGNISLGQTAFATLCPWDVVLVLIFAPVAAQVSEEMFPALEMAWGLPGSLCLSERTLVLENDVPQAHSTALVRRPCVLVQAMSFEW